MRLLKLNSPEWMYILTGCLMAILQGATMPCYAIIFGEYIENLAECDDEKAQENSNLFALLFVGIGILAGVSMFLQIFMFTLAGEALTQRLRRMTFAAMLRQELGWYDDASNSVGSLSARLSGDAASVQGVCWIFQFFKL